MEFPEKERIDGVFKYFGEYAGVAKIIVSHVALVLKASLIRARTPTPPSLLDELEVRISRNLFKITLLDTLRTKKVSFVFHRRGG